MAKFILFPVQFLVLFGITTFLSLEITIQQNFPERIPAEGECEVELTINKSSVSGFAKFQHTFPEGVEVKSVEAAGATFTYAQQKMKFIWMALPEEETFTVKYHLNITDPSITEVELGGTFSYLEDNKRMVYDVPPEKLAVGEDPQTVEEQVNPYAQVERQVSDLGNQQFRIDIHVKKENVSGFAKIQDFLPAGAVASNMAEMGSVFSVVDNKVKFVWMNLPEESAFTVSYQLDLAASTVKNPNEIKGEFAFIHKGQTEKVAIVPEGSTTEPEPAGEAPVASTEAEDPTPETTPSTEPEPSLAVVTDPEPVQPEPETPPTSKDPETTKPEPKPEPEAKPKPAPVQPKPTPKPEPKPAPITSVPDPKTGVNYRVQLLAGHNNVNASYFERQHAYQDIFFIENHEGWFKYTTGNFNEYRKARDGRERVKGAYNFPGPFVVAYNNGERITVQEALMITHQKWVK